jgi:hypothetical protein
MACTIKFCDGLITTIHIFEENAGTDLLKWLFTHNGPVSHLACIYRLYARNKYKNKMIICNEDYCHIKMKSLYIIYKIENQVKYWWYNF